jgi:hypothetical protein
LIVLYRSYKNAEEKWQLTEEILEIFYQIISKYEVNTDDFQHGSNTNDLDFVQINQFKSPLANSSGYRLMYDFIHDGPIVRMLFTILNECLAHMCEFNPTNNAHIEQCSLTCLKIVSLLLEKQRTFVEQMRAANLNIECTGLEKLIVTLNPATNKADYFMTILRYIQFNSSLTNHSFYSLNVVYMLSNYSLVNSQLLNLFLKSCLSLNEQFELMHSFVDFLEYDESEMNELSKDDNLLFALKTNLNVLDDGDGSPNTSENSINAVAANGGSLVTQSSSGNILFLILNLR